MGRLNVNICLNHPLILFQELHRLVSQTSSSVKMAAVPSRFGVVMATTTVTTTLMKQTVVSFHFFCEGKQRQTDFIYCIRRVYH